MMCFRRFRMFFGKAYGICSFVGLVFLLGLICSPWAVADSLGCLDRLFRFASMHSIPLFEYFLDLPSETKVTINYVVALFIFIFMVTTYFFYLKARKAQQKVVALLNAVPARIGICDVDGNVLFVKFEHAFDKLNEKTIETIDDFPGVDVPQTKDLFNRFFQSNQFLEKEYSSFGTSRIIRINPLPETLYGKKALIWLSYDNSKLHENKEKLKETNESLVEKTQLLACESKKIQKLADELAEKNSVLVEKGKSLESALKDAEDKKAKLDAANAQLQDKNLELSAKERILSDKNLELLKASKALEAQKEKSEQIAFIMKQILHFIPCHVYVKDRSDNGRYLFTSAQLEKDLCLNRSSLVGLTDKDFLDNEIAEKFLEAESKLVNNGDNNETFEREKFINEPEHRRDRLFLVRRVLIKENGLNLVVGIGVDVTDLQTLKDQLNMRRELLSLVTEYMPFYFYAKTDESQGYKYVYANDEFCKILGTNNIVGLTDGDLFGDEASYGIRSDDQIVLHEPNRKVVACENIITGSDGRKFKTRSFKKLFVDSKGSRFILGASSDVTEETKNKNEINSLNNLVTRLRADLDNANKESRHKEDFLSLIVDVAPIYFFVKDASNNFAYAMCNQAFADWVGKSKSQILNHTDKELFAVNSTVDIFKEKDQEVMNNNQLLEFNEKVVGGDGKPVNIRTIKKPVLSKRGRDLLIGIGVNIDELVNLQESEQIYSRLLTEISKETDFTTNLKSVLCTLATQVQCSGAGVVSYDADNDSYTLEKVYHTIYPDEEVVNGNKEADRLMRSGHSYFLNNKIFSVSNAAVNPECDEWVDKGVQSFIAAPIFVDGKLWGAVVVWFTNTIRNFSSVDQRIMQAMADVISLAWARKCQMDAVILSKREQQLILDNIKIPIWLFDVDAKFVSSNAEAKQFAERHKCSAPQDDPFTSRLGPEALREMFASAREGKAYLQSYSDIQGRDYTVYYDPVIDNQTGKLLNVLRSAVDVTEANRILTREKAIGNAMMAVLDKKNQTDFTPQDNVSLLKIATEYLNCSSCFVVKFRHNRVCGSADSLSSREECELENAKVCSNNSYYKRELANIEYLEADFFEKEAFSVKDNYFEYPQKQDNLDFVNFLASLSEDERLLAFNSPETVITLDNPLFLPVFSKFNRNNSKEPLFGSLYSAGLFIGGRLWGCLCVTYSQNIVELEEKDTNFVKTAAFLLSIQLEREYTSAALRKALQMTKTSEKAMSEFVATMSHEIRTPLNGILLSAELLENEDIKQDIRFNYLHNIVMSGRSLMDLVNNVLDLSKLEADQVQIVTVPIDFVELLEELSHLFTIMARQKGLNFITSIAQMPILFLDKIRVRQILTNILGNAVKYTVKGHISLKASVEFNDNQTLNLKVLIEDTGVGISEKEQKNLFEPFYQAKNVHETLPEVTGTGLGLPISRQLAEVMGGELLLSSVQGEGSCFTLLLRNVSYLEKSKSSESAAVPVQETEGNLNKIKVLIVDDNATNSYVEKQALTGKGAKVTVVTSPYQALEQLEHELYDVVLTDMWMPGMNGDALACEIKESFPELPVALITGDTRGKKEFNRSIFDKILFKPVCLQDLLASVAELTRKHGKGRAD